MGENTIAAGEPPTRIGVSALFIDVSMGVIDEVLITHTVPEGPDAIPTI